MNHPSSTSVVLRSRPFAALGERLALLAIVVIGTVAPILVAAAAGPQEVAKGYAQTKTAGVFTGEFVDGAPVYRFPPVVVVGSRAEPVRSEERVAQPLPMKAPAARGPA